MSRRSTFLRIPLAALAAVLLLAGFSTERTEASRRHARLLKSLPMADSTVKQSPLAIELWFSEKIELGPSKIELLDANKKAIPVSTLTRDDSKPDSPVVGRLVTELPDGTYAVRWTAAAKDGHPVKGTFFFNVKAK
ncbi:MAG: copper resistance protein CopC [Gemmatimonadaceae bacterium]